MNTKQEKSGNLDFDSIIIPPNGSWFDPIGIRFFANTTKDSLKLEFGHNIRTVEVIAIAEAAEEKKKSAAIEALEGEIIEEDVV